MVTVLQANQLTLREVKDRFSLAFSQDPDFFSEWQIAASDFSEYEREVLDQAKANFLYLAEYPVQEALVKMVVVSPLLSVAGFYNQPFRTYAEQTTEIAVANSATGNGNELIRGRIDVLVVNQSLWVAVIEAKGSQFSLGVGLPQTLAYMASSKDKSRPQFGLITNGTEFLFIKLALPEQGQPVYGLSKTYSLNNPGNDLYTVTSVLKALS